MVQDAGEAITPIVEITDQVTTPMLEDIAQVATLVLEEIDGVVDPIIGAWCSFLLITTQKVHFYRLKLTILNTFE